MDTRMLRRAGVLAMGVGLAAVGTIAVPSAASASTPSGGTEHLRIVTTAEGQAATIIIRGPYADGGVDYSRGSKDLAVFPDGSFTIQHPNGQYDVKVNPRTCIAHVTVTGDYTLTNGYGAYRGVTGQGTYEGHGLAHLDRRDDGTCDTHGKPQADVFSVRASGTMST